MSGPHSRNTTIWQPLEEADVDRMRFRRQWVIAPRSDEPDVTWRRILLNEHYELHHHPETRIARASSGGVAHIVLGVAFMTHDGGALVDGLEALCAAPADRVPEFLHGLAGTYVLIRAASDEVTVFTDPAGLMGVYRGHGRVASSPPLLGRLERDTDLDEEFPFKGDNDWYPGELTPYRGVTALTPNHLLRVGAGTTRRFWPLQEARPLSVGEGTQRLASLLRSNVLATLGQGHVVCSITGGRDSRINVAALREHTQDVDFFTVRGPAIRECDVQIPQQIARDFGLNHRFVEMRVVPPWLEELYDQMTGGLSIGGGRSIVGAVNELAGSGNIHLNGNLGALTKSFFWHSRHPREVRPNSLMKEFVYKPPRVREAVARWLASVPDLAPSTVYNLMYLEQRGNRSMSPGETASQLFYDSVTPFASREVFEVICGMPASAQYGGGLLVDLVQRLWPELAQVPYCRARRNWSRYVPRRVKSTLKQSRSTLRSGRSA